MFLDSSDIYTTHPSAKTVILPSWALHGRKVSRTYVISFEAFSGAMKTASSISCCQAYSCLQGPYTRKMFETASGPCYCQWKGRVRSGKDSRQLLALEEVPVPD